MLKIQNKKNDISLEAADCCCQIENIENSELPAAAEKTCLETFSFLRKKIKMFSGHNANAAAAFILSFILFIIGIASESYINQTSHWWIEYIIFLSAYFLAGHRVIFTALRNIIKKRAVFDENFLMTLSTAGAILIHHLPEAVGVMLFYYLGEILQDAAVNRSRRSIKDLLDIRPDYANLKTDNGIKTIPPQEVSEGNLIVIKPGEKIPLDGIVVEGTSFIDTSALTGESLPRRVKPGDKILAGMVNSTGLLTVKVIKTYEESSASKILKLVEQAGERKASTEKFITKFSRYYTPAVVFVSIIIAFVPPLTIEGAAFKDWFYRALTLLVISCPCALVISIPLGFFGGIGGASKRGILIKGANFLEALTNIHTAAFDKTGTLTWGVFKVSKIETLNLSPNKLLYYAAAAEYYSNHPIAKSILERYRETNTNPIDPKIIKNYREIPGYGVKAEINGRKVVVGSAGLMQKEKIKSMPASNPHSNTTVYVAIDGIFAGIIYISDEIKEDAKLTIKKLKELGVKRIVMLTGDSQKSAEEAAKKIGINEYYADLLPQDKVKLMEKLITEKKNEKGYVVFVGDGINDAPVLARADIGVAVEGSASDAAIEAADVVLMGSSPSKLVEAVKIAYFTKKIILQNIFMALGIKIGFILLGAAGSTTLWEAVFADVGVALIAVINASRVLNFRSRSLFNLKAFQN